MNTFDSTVANGLPVIVIVHSFGDSESGPEFSLSCIKGKVKPSKWLENKMMNQKDYDRICEEIESEKYEARREAKSNYYDMRQL